MSSLKAQGSGLRAQGSSRVDVVVGGWRDTPKAIYGREGLLCV